MKRALRSIFTASIIGLASLCFAATSNAAPITISTYDAINTQPAGFGGWSHFYTGTIMNNLGGTINETDASGTLNDGIIGTSHQDAHLFYNALTFDDTYFDLYLGQSAYINSINLFSTLSISTLIPGNITGVNVTINGNTANFQTTGFGPMNFDNHVPIHELINLTGSGLDTLLTNQIRLSGFTTSAYSYATSFTAKYSNISEITIDGTPYVAPVPPPPPAPVPTPTPEPSTMILLGTGVAALALFRKKFKRS